jgi:hypothetical protein
MKLSELVRLVYVSLAIGSKKIAKTWGRIQRGDQGGASQPNWILASSSISNDRSLKISP